MRRQTWLMMALNEVTPYIAKTDARVWFAIWYEEYASSTWRRKIDIDL